MVWRCGLMLVGVLLSVGCLQENRCEVDGELLVCTDGTEVSTEGENVPEDVVCRSDGREITCDSGHRFDVDDGVGEQKPGAEDDDRGPDEPRFPGDRQDNSGWESCLAEEEGVLTCENGDQVADESFWAGRDDCRWHRRPGVGPRIVCDEDDSEWVPEGEEEVSCRWRARGGGSYVECSDGSRERFGDKGPGECEPEFSSAAGGYEIRCGDEVKEVEDTSASWCGYPDGEVVVDSESVLEELWYCAHVFGDLVIYDVEFENIWELEFIETISGNLYIVDNEELFDLGIGDLWLVEGRMVVIGNEELGEIPFIETVRYVDEGVEITGNDWLEVLGFPYLHETSEMSIGSNPELVDFFITDELEIEGGFFFAGNTRFPLCWGLELLAQATEIAEGGAFVGDLADESDSRWACE